MTEPEKPFRFLTSDEFMALTDKEREIYLQRQREYLALRQASRVKQKKPEQKS